MIMSVTAAVIAASTIVGRRLFTQHHEKQLFKHEHMLHELESNANVLYIGDPLTLQWIMSTLLTSYVCFFMVGLWYEFISATERFDIQQKYLINNGPPIGCDPSKEISWLTAFTYSASTDECIEWTIKTTQKTINYGTVFNAYAWQYTGYPVMTIASWFVSLGYVGQLIILIGLCSVIVGYRVL